MRIISVHIRNFRTHDDLFVEFDSLRTVIAGPNESGKSTLVEALDRALFHPFKSTRDLSRLKPKATGGIPEVIVAFERHGRTHVLRKLFKGAQSVATLTDDAGNEYKGDDAESQLRKLLGLGDGALNKPLFGWSHLWAHQDDAGDDPLSPESLGDVPKELDRRLQGMAGNALTESTRDSIAFDRVAAAHDDLFTIRGVRSGSSLDVAIRDLAEARADATDAATQLLQYEDAADTVLREQAAIASHSRMLKDAEQALADTRPKIVLIEKLEKDLESQRAAAHAADLTYATLAQGDADIRSLATSIEGLEGELAPKETEIEALAARERQLRDSVTRAASAIATAMKSHEGAVTRAELLAKLKQTAALEDEQASLERSQRQIDELNCTITAIDDRLRDLPVVDEAALNEVERLDRELALGKGKLEAIATRIEVISSAEQIAIDGVQLTAGDARTLTETTRLQVGDGTTILITPGDGGSLAALRIAVGELETELRSRLAQLGVADVTKAREANRSRAAELADRTRNQERIEDLGGEATKKRLDEVVGEIKNLTSGIKLLATDDFARPTDAAALAAAVTEADQRKRDAAGELDVARTSFEEATRSADATRTAWEEAEAEVRDLRKEIQDLTTRKTMLEQQHGVDREDKLSELAKCKKSATDAVVETERALRKLDASTTRDDLERYERAATQASGDIVEAGKRKAKAEGALQNAGMSDLHGAKAAAEARVDVAMRRHAEVARRADAVRRLHELFHGRRQAVADLVAAPLRDRVAEYLDALYGPGCRVSFARQEESFTSLEVARPTIGGLRFEFGDLSGGTREQVAATCRLAMAELLAGNSDREGDKTCLPMIFDDAFTNSDPDRIKAVQRVLYLAAKRGLQIIVLTCNPEDYGLFAAKRVDLPPPKSAGTVAAAPTVMTRNGFRQDEDAADADTADDAGDDLVRPDRMADSPDGSTPAGDDASLAETMIAEIRSSPGPRVGNKTLREQLGWDVVTYERIKQRLVAEKRIKRARGKGGSVYISDDSDDDEDDSD